MSRPDLSRETTLERFLRYARIDTQSKEDTDEVPSTPRQLDLARLLLAELEGLGIAATLDAHGYVMAAIPSNLPPDHPARGQVPAIGFIAHLDTSPSAPGAGVRPQVLTYQGGDLVLPGDPSVVIRASENPELAHALGRTIVTSDGTTLLGADDKAGVAVIMTLAERLARGPGFLHPEVKLAFTPDEEVGNGTKYFDLERFGAAVAYTVDGEAAPELNRETFSADSATITVYGRNIHPGKAKGIMVNALRVLADVVVRLPRDQAPETTDGYQPYIHPHGIEGEEAKATLKLLLRDFRTEGLAEQRVLLERVIAEVQALHPKARIELGIKESYRNMRYGLEKDPRAAELLEAAARRAGLEPTWAPIRGGTDGSRLTALGLPTPNLFTGGQNFHGLTEWLSVDGMEKALATAEQVLQLFVERAPTGSP